MHKIEIEAPVSEEFLGDILVCAFDGNYGSSWEWSRPGCEDWLVTSEGSWKEVRVRFDVEDAPSLALQMDYRAQIRAGGVKISYEEVTVGIARILSDERNYTDKFRANIRQAVAENDAGMIDAIDADCIVQEALFGRQVY